MEAETAKAPTEQGHRQGSTAAQFEHGELPFRSPVGLFVFKWNETTKQKQKEKSQGFSVVDFCCSPGAVKLRSFHC
jgi:hypothetical protein